jgi:hypothetical protein
MGVGESRIQIGSCGPAAAVEREMGNWGGREC